MFTYGALIFMICHHRALVYFISPRGSNTWELEVITTRDESEWKEGLGSHPKDFWMDEMAVGKETWWGMHGDEDPWAWHA
jgi:hypothetical protein